MIIDCIADLHGFYPKLDGGDLLIVAGDLTARDTEKENSQFFDWLYQQNYTGIVFIAGNHDNVIEKDPYFFNRSNPKRIEELTRNAAVKVQYLCDSGTEFEYEIQVDHPCSNDRISIDVLCYEKRKLKIWGSPWTKTFEGMNPHCKAFTCDTEEELEEKWKKIPYGVDILITHSPPFKILDQVCYINAGEDVAEHVGSTSLKEYVLNKVKPKLWIWGHIHEAYGQREIVLDYPNTITCVNASHVNEHYKPVNKPIRIIL